MTTIWEAGLRTLLVNDVALEAVTTRSYWHPNHFAKLVLTANGDDIVRLHVWPAGSNRPGDSNPHSHRWRFTSTVLCGSFDDTHYTDVTDAPDVNDDDCWYQLHAFADRNERDAMTFVGPRQLRETSTRARTAGQCYALSTSVIHTIRPRGTGLVATVVSQDRPVHNTARVYGLPGRDVAAPGRPLTSDEVRALLTSVVTTLAGRP